MNSWLHKLHQNRHHKKFGVSSYGGVMIDYTYRILGSDEVITELGLQKGTAIVGSTLDHQNLLAHADQHDQLEKVYESLGGSCCNVLRCLSSSLNENTSFTTVIGSDDISHMITKTLDVMTPKLDLQTLKTDGPASSVIVLVSDDGERSMHANISTDQITLRDHSPSSHVLSSSIFHFSGYGWTHDYLKKIIKKLLPLASNDEVFFSFDAADHNLAKQCREDFIQLIDHCHIIFCNHPEVVAIFGEDFDILIRDKYSDKLFVIKQGGHDAMIITQNEIIKIPACPNTPVLDTTGAGDIFAAGFLKGILHQTSLETAAKMAHLLAADVISRYGTNISEEAAQQALQFI